MIPFIQQFIKLEFKNALSLQGIGDHISHHKFKYTYFSLITFHSWERQWSSSHCLLCDLIFRAVPLKDWLEFMCQSAQSRILFKPQLEKESGRMCGFQVMLARKCLEFKLWQPISRRYLLQRPHLPQWHRTETKTYVRKIVD